MLKLLKVSRGKGQITCKGKSIIVTADYSREPFRDRSTWEKTFIAGFERFLGQTSISSETVIIQGVIKTFHDEIRLK